MAELIPSHLHNFSIKSLQYVSGSILSGMDATFGFCGTYCTGLAEPKGLAPNGLVVVDVIPAIIARGFMLASGFIMFTAYAW